MLLGEIDIFGDTPLRAKSIGRSLQLRIDLAHSWLQGCWNCIPRPSFFVFTVPRFSTSPFFSSSNFWWRLRRNRYPCRLRGKGRRDRGRRKWIQRFGWWSDERLSNLVRSGPEKSYLSACLPIVEKKEWKVYPWNNVLGLPVVSWCSEWFTDELFNKYVKIFFFQCHLLQN